MCYITVIKFNLNSYIFIYLLIPVFQIPFRVLTKKTQIYPTQKYKNINNNILNNQDEIQITFLELKKKFNQKINKVIIIIKINSLLFFCHPIYHNQQTFISTKKKIKFAERNNKKTTLNKSKWKTISLFGKLKRTKKSYKNINNRRQ